MRGLLYCWPALLLWPSPAVAHSPLPGIEGFYTGLLHPFSTPSQAVVMLGTGLLVGGFRPPGVWWPLGAFGIATLAGLMLASLLPEPGIALFSLAFVICALAALLPGKMLGLATALALVAGLLIGIVSVPDPGPVQDRAITMSGSIVGANLGLLYLFGMVQWVNDRYPKPWIGIAFRVVAAWIGALSIVMLALRVAVQTPPV